jgi:hypothetical protein
MVNGQGKVAIMSKDESRRSSLTRSLLAGVALGSVALVQVGCTTQDGGAGAGGFTQASGSVGTEAELCDRALASRSRGDVEALLRSYPNGRCVPATLAAMPPQTLSQLSPSVVGRMSPSTLGRIPPETAIHLRRPGRWGAASGTATAASSASSAGAGPY